MQSNEAKNPTAKELKDFGLIWAAVFFLISIIPLFKGEGFKLWAFLVSFAFSSIAFSFPEIFDKIKFYQAWIKFGEIIGKINSKIIITFLFYFIFTPIGLVLKMLRKDLLAKNIDKSSGTYFIDCQKDKNDMKNQF